ncbi:hypothetical protein DM01DRAFT_1335120 [Hesseltinella vesiculosa]|uniref:FHA domain-containing protein n=1 Tax=Hesseltinella vesiculosa TaxID=101127 RepID=A0A1X2GK94_9FUNG|nr:hypothetical protein DM01DRAFT_1335120 [Hesseltinella vesiculosa]
MSINEDPHLSLYHALDRPPTPEPFSSDMGFNSDDLVPTSMLGDDLEEEENDSPVTRLVLIGAFDRQLTLGRGGACTVKIGRRNRQISRVHASIDYAEDYGRFELLVQGMNGVTVDQLRYRKNERAPLNDHSIIDILGDVIEFCVPVSRPSSVSLHTKPVQYPTLSPEPTDDQPMLAAAEEDQQEAVTTDAALHDIAQHAAAVLSPATHLPVPEPKDEPAVQPDSRLSSPPVLQKEEAPVALPKEEPVSVKPEPVVALPLLDAQIDKENNPQPPVLTKKKKKEPLIKLSSINDNIDLGDLIIEVLVFSKKSSMPISDICSRILKTNPSYRQEPREVWHQRIQKVLKEQPYFGEIVRKGKTADGSPKEHLYYYSSDQDPVDWRRSTYTQVGRSARKCTLQDKQYFWRIPPKLGRNRNAYIPPPGPLQEKRKNELLPEDDAKKQKF